MLEYSASSYKFKMLLTRICKFNNKRGFCNLPMKPMDKTSFLAGSRKSNTIASLLSSKCKVPPVPYDITLDISHNFLTSNGLRLLHLKLENNQQIIKPSTFICLIDVSGSMQHSSSYRGDPEASKFSRLDLVKHSINTIIHCLRPEDSLALLTFSDNCQTVLDVTKMDRNGKKIAQKILYDMSANGGTNLWSGLETIMNKFNNNNNNFNENKFFIVLTDGEPNINPPRGILNEFRDKLDGQLIGNMHTLGYGYGLDSDLLLRLASLGDGGFMHIPDYSMCNTVFINLLANCLSTCIQNVVITPNTNGICSQSWFHPLSRSSLNIGQIQSGQSRVVQFLIPQAADELVFDIQYHGQRIEYIAKKSNISATNWSTDFTRSLFKSELLPILEDSLNFYIGIDRNHEVICEKLERLYRRISSLKSDISDDIIVRISSLKSDRPDVFNDELNAWLNNIESPSSNSGQLMKAFSNVEYFNRWGTHYLRYFSRSHQLEMCTNFLDTSLQIYGGSLFKNLRTEIEDIFAEIEVPQPSLSSTPFTGNFKSTFYSPNNPCFDGDCRAKIYDPYAVDTFKLTFIKNLKKGDKVVNNHGQISTIVCVVKTHIPNNVTELVLLNGLRVTPYHPIYQASKWVQPCKIKEPLCVYCESTYNFVLDCNHTMSIEGIDVITMGHNIIDDDVLRHPFFGSSRVIECLQQKPGWNEGLVELFDYNPIYDENGLISWF